MSAGPETEGEPDEEWRFSLEEIDAMQENGERADADGEQDDSAEQQGQLEPGDIRLENAIFVVLGAALVIGLIGAAYFGI